VVVAVEFDAPPTGDPARLLSSKVSANILRTLDAKLSKGLKYGSGTKNESSVSNITSPSAAITWPVRTAEKGTYTLKVVYDAALPKPPTTGPAPTTAPTPPGGTYRISLGDQAFTGVVKTGTRQSETLGTVTVEPGTYELKLTPVEITGPELMRPREVILEPVK
jgi:hypothetical protein